MTLLIGSLVTILANQTHPRLAGRVGVVTHVTPARKTCGVSHVTNHPHKGSKPRARVTCGGNLILEVEGVGRVLVPKECVTVVAGEGVAA
jgi:hypothetical protein